MDYKPPVHILIRRRTDLIGDDDMAFLEKALAIQLREAAEAYGLYPPGITFSSPTAIVPSTEAAGMDMMDDDGVPEAIAHHGWYAGFPWSIIGVGETYQWTAAASHEALEYLRNLRLDQWALGPNGTRWPIEIADPVESDTYPIDVEIFGERRAVVVSNYVLPAYWKESSKGPWDRLGTLKGPFTIAPGGYAVVENEEGEIVQYGSSVRHPPIRKKSKPSSRAEQIIRAHVAGLRHGAHF
jgi:hypothetical protein